MSKESTSNSTFNIRRGILLVGSGSAISMIFLFVETMIAARLLSTVDYGIYVLLVAIVNFLIVAVDLGGKTAITQMIASRDGQQRQVLVGTVLSLRICAIAVLALIVWLAREPFLVLFEAESYVGYLGWLVLMLLGASFDELLLGIQQGFHAYRHIAAAQIVRSISRLGLTILLLVGFQLGPMALIYSWIISSALSVIYQILVLPVSRRLRLHTPLLREVIRFGFPLQMTRFLWFGFRRMGVLLLAMLSGPASVAFYEVAARIPDALQNLSESYTAVYFPTVTELLAKGKRSQALRVLNQTVRLISFAVALVAIGATVFSHEIVTLIFTEKYAASVPAFVLLMIALQMTITVSLMGYTLTAAGFPGRSLAENTTRVGTNLLGHLLLIPVMGFVGPALARLAGNYISMPMVVWLLWRSDVDVEVSPAAKQIVVLLGCAALYWWLQPPEFVYKASIVGLFLLLSFALSIVSLEDLNLIWDGKLSAPTAQQRAASTGDNLTTQPEMAKETATHGD